MSDHARVTVFYGICYPHGSADAAKFDASDDNVPAGRDASPAALAYWGGASDGVEVVAYGHYDEESVGLADASLVTKGKLWEPVALGGADPHPDADAKLRAYCEKYGLTYTQPRWWAVPYYG